LNVFTFHRYLAQIMQEGCGPERFSILRGHVKTFSEFIGDSGDTHGVRVLVPFKLIGGRGQLQKSLGRGAIEVVD
jgi:hypothetical protein